MDLRDAWRKVFPDHPQLPQSALAVIGPLARDAAACKALQTAYVQAAGWMVAHPREATALAGKKFPALASQAVDGVLPGQDKVGGQHIAMLVLVPFHFKMAN